LPAPADSLVVVFGTGALACAIGGVLARADGGTVTLVGSWRAGRAAVAKRGIVVHEPAGTWSARVATSSLDEAPRPVELALVLTKSHRTLEVAPAVARALAPTGLAVTLQNGLGNRETLEAALGRARVAVGITMLGAVLVAPGEVRVVPGRIVLGEEPQTAERLGPLAARLRAAGIEVETTREVPRLVWTKLVVNCAINPLTALAGLPNGGLLDDPELRETLLAAAGEVGAVATARGITLNADPGTHALQAAEATASNRSSMLQDLERGAITEIDALNGAVVAEGRRLGVPTPVNESLWHRVRTREGRPVTDAPAQRERPA
jgi:2-dehydropantoate 2-reductase